MLFARLVGDAAFVSVQNPVRLDDYSEPQPDLALLKRARIIMRKPSHALIEVLLIVEVADSSVLYDRNVKVPLYAQALIPVVWLIDFELPKRLKSTRNRPTARIKHRRVFKSRRPLNPRITP